MNYLLTEKEQIKSAIVYLENKSTQTDWRIIEESLKMAKLKASLNFQKDLFAALRWPIDKNSYLNYLNEFNQWVPYQSNAKVWMKPGTSHSQEVYDRLCHFYFLVSQETSIGIIKNQISWFQEFLEQFTNDWGLFLTTPKSFNDDILISYIKQSPQYRIQDSLINGRPNNNWTCYNDFFARQLNDGLRPISSPFDNNIVTSPADSTYLNTYAIDANSNIKEVTIKQTHKFTSTQELLKGSKYADSFTNGTCIHYFLGPYAYHRFHSPVSGLVKESFPIFDVNSLDVSVSDNGVFETSTNTIDGNLFSQARGVLIIDTRNSPYGDMGFVAVVPVGMCHIASVHMLATPDTVLDKGEEFGFFKFGGSDVLLIFQEGKAPIIDECKEYRHYGDSISTCPVNQK